MLLYCIVILVIN